MMDANHSNIEPATDTVKPLSNDTPLEVEQRWLMGLPEKGPVWRLVQAVRLSSHCWRAAQTAFQRARPHADPMEQDTWLLQERYGSAIASRVVERRQQQGFYDS